MPFWNSFDAREILKYFSTIVVVGCWFTMWFAHVQLRICTYGQHFKCISKRLKMRAERNNAIGIRAQTKIFKTWYKKSQFFVLQNKSYRKSIPKSVTGHTHKIHSYSCWRVFFFSDFLNVKISLAMFLVLLQIDLNDPKQKVSDRFVQSWGCTLSRGEV